MEFEKHKSVLRIVLNDDYQEKCKIKEHVLLLTVMKHA